MSVVCASSGAMLVSVGHTVKGAYIGHKWPALTPEVMLMLAVHAVAEGHVCVCLSLPPKAMWMPMVCAATKSHVGYRLPGMPSGIMLMSLACATTEDYDSVCGVQWQRTVLMSMVCTATGDHAEVCDTC